MRTPRSRLYDGAIYGTFLDPILGGLHARVAREIPDGARVIDAGCGTGDLLFRVASRLQEGLGIELSPVHVAYAKRRGAENLSFQVADAAHLDLPDGRFDLATILLAIHEMPADQRVPVLAELGRVAREVLILDWATPMPWNAAGLRNRALEIGAGPEHFRAYLDFQRSGGLNPLLSAAGLAILEDHPVDAGSIRLIRARVHPREAAGTTT